MSCLFFIRFAQTVRSCIGDIGPAFMSGLEMNTINRWLSDPSITNKQEKSALHLHRLHQYLAYRNDQLTDTQIQEIVSSWSYWKTHSIKAPHLWPDVESAVENYYLHLLPTIAPRLTGDLLNQTCTQILENCNIALEQFPQGASWVMTTPPQALLSIAPRNVWAIDCATGSITSSAGIMVDSAVPSKWTTSSCYTSLFLISNSNILRSGLPTILRMFS